MANPRPLHHSIQVSRTRSLTRRLRGVLRILGRAGRAALDKFPFTALGSLLLGCGWLAVREMGQKRQDVVLYVAGLGVLAVVVVAALLVVAAALYVGVPIRPRALPHSRFEAGRIEQTGFSLPSLGLLPLVSVDWDWVVPEAVRLEKRLRKGRVVEEVTFGERGEHDRTVRRVVIEDVLGHRARRVPVQRAHAAHHPSCPGRPLASPLLEAFAAGDAVSHPAGPPDGDPGRHAALRGGRSDEADPLEGLCTQPQSDGAPARARHLAHASHAGVPGGR